MFETIIEGAIYIVASSINAVLYSVSPQFREKKRKEWANNLLGKYWELGVGGICLVSVIVLVLWLWSRRSRFT